MGRLNIYLTSRFEKLIAAFMRVRGIPTKSEAIRTAIQEGLDRATHQSRAVDFRTLLGAGKRVPENPNPRFHSDKELWD